MRLRISTTTRIALGLTSLMVACLFVAAYVGLVPDARRPVLDGRCSLAEAIAVQCCLAAQRDDIATMRAILDALAARNPSVLSAAVRRKTGTLAAEVGDHGRQWLAGADRSSTGSQLSVPIYRDRSVWGTVEIRFRPVTRAGWRGWLMTPMVGLVLFLAVTGFVASRLYLRKVLRLLDPRAVVPDRVRATLDTLTEGVIILDKRQQIVLANKAFADRLGASPVALQGLKPSDLKWSLPDGELSPESYPWIDALSQGVTRTGIMMRMPGVDDVRTLSVSAMPIVGDGGERRGVLATFDDVTTLEKQNLALEEMLEALKVSRDEIQRQNRDLHLLATFDPLTQCLNRRSFFEKLDLHWNNSRRYGQVISFVMVDIDHFKSINDRFGHGTGDVVLKTVGETLRASVRECDLVCRYGGEEFCVLLPQQDGDHALVAAERYRAAVAGLRFDRFSLTASFGVATNDGTAGTSQELLERADKALYAAKDGGRNRVVRWGTFSPKETPAGDPEREDSSPPESDSAAATPIPFQVVTALTSVLACHDTMIAEHSRRVAELCVACAKGLLPQHECYELEMAALLHDIGTVAIPDAILKKPGQLTDEEWSVMRRHVRIGEEILRSAFATPRLIEIVRTHHAWYSGSPHDPALPREKDILPSTRILAIADAFVAMASDCHYRKKCSPEDAFAELRRCAGTQFDPELVERFIKAAGECREQRPAPHTGVSRQTALDMGLEIERLTVALDARDFGSLSARAGHLAGTAAEGGAAEIAERATELEGLAASEPNMRRIVQVTSDLLELCSATQRSHLDQPSTAANPAAMPQ